MDLLRLPAIGAIFRRGRLGLQLSLLAIALLIVAHGLFGPQIAPRNLATVLTWVHYRGLLVVALLAVGNLFCTSCPMMLVRDTGRRVWHPALRWPHRLRGKWLGIALLAGVLLAYEVFDLWQLPRATAWLVIGYFAAACVVDVLFSGATFCKHLCPVGQFNFVASVMSPTELQARDLHTCRACTTVDCIKGRRVAPRTVQRGCELALFMPNKVGNLDCTMCGDCVRACPHDNIALVIRVPGAELLDTRRHSGIGRLGQRQDLAALFVVFTGLALLNAFAMTQPGVALGPLGLVLLFAAGLAVPVALLTRRTWIHYAYTLAPLGFGIWLAHYSFHVLTGALTAVPVTQAAAIDLLGFAALGEPLWRMVGMQPGSVFPLQLGFLLLGSAGTLGLMHATSLRDCPAAPWRASIPWFVLGLALTTLAIWTLAQPMAMRGVGVG
jgi:polyferredoxin